MPIITPEDAREIARAALAAHGCDGLNAAAVADTIARAERDGAASHGLFRLPGYIGSLKSGKVNGASRPRIEQRAPAILHVDGDGGYAPVAHQALAGPLAEAAKAQGVALAAITNTHHFSALWAEVELLAEQGVAAIACVSFKPALPPAGGVKPLYGTNPLAFAWPRPGKQAVVFDQASAVMARGEVMIAARDGHRLPEGAGIGPDGNPTTDPNEVLKGALLPFGGYKGASLAMMIELLAGPLIGESLSVEAAETDKADGGPPRGGEFILAIDPGRARGDGGWAAHAERLFAEIVAQEGARLPGEGRAARRARIAAQGIEIAEDRLAELRAMAEAAA
ncbi:MAG TPA: Ldh family oxidoreductase [Thermohalobaculum sp.]|nr:Ldh family oxidoreductase [Thermohalobaculum sp.]